MKSGTVLFYIELPTIQPTLMKKPKVENLHHAHYKIFKATFQNKEAVIDLINFLFTPEEAALIDIERF